MMFNQLDGSISGSPLYAVAECTVIGFFGLSSVSVATIPILCTTPIPEYTLPKIVCFPSRNGVGFKVIKNCDPVNQKRQESKENEWRKFTQH